MFDVIAQWEEDEYGNEFGGVDHVKRFREVNHHRQCAEWGQGFSSGCRRRFRTVTTGQQSSRGAS